MLTPEKTRDLARSLVAREADSNTTSLQTEPASGRVYEMLRRQLGAPVGADGFQSLAARSLALARSESPRLRAVQVMANGALRGLDEVESQTNSDENGEVGIILIAQLIGLFLTLLGEATTLRLIEDLRPQAEIRTESVTASLDTADSLSEDLAIASAFEELLLEVDQLRKVSGRIGNLAGKHPGMVEGLLSCWKRTQHCDGSGRFHTYPKQGRRFAGRRTRPTNEPLYELSADGAPLRFRTFWIVKRFRAA
jgi:hypothetical protein